ncbi:hypothetical protein G5V59_01555 [Nocardioides sp. W3-2-3]|nr:hypothetical protein [Nocardioides convexus]
MGQSVSTTTSEPPALVLRRPVLLRQGGPSAVPGAHRLLRRGSRHRCPAGPGWQGSRTSPPCSSQPAGPGREEVRRSRLADDQE